MCQKYGVTRIAGVVVPSAAPQNDPPAYFGYDALRRMTSVNDVRGATAYAYTARSQTQRETLPDGTSAYYEYDAAGNRTAVSVTGVGSTYYEYDALNRVTSVKTFLGNTASFVYDEEGAITTKVWPNGRGERAVEML